MKNLLIILMISFCASYTFGQGIQFEEGNWKQVIAAAKKQNKPIFIDVYTSWCGPCKVMAQHVFTEKLVGDIFNDGFINYKIDAEKGEGVALAKRYEVQAFPTFLIVDPKNEELIHKEVGALSINNFIAMADLALQKGGYTKNGKSLDVFENAFAKGDRSPDFLVAFMRQNILSKKSNHQLADTLFAYLPKDKRLMQPYIGYLALNVSQVNSPLFGFLASQHEDVTKAINAGDQLFFEAAMLGATRSLNSYKDLPDESIVKNMNAFRNLVSSKKVMLETYYYGSLGRYFRNIKDSVAYLALARDYGNSIIFQTTKQELEKMDRDALAEVQAKLNSGEIDSAYYKAKTRNPNNNRDQAAIRMSNLAFDVARIARTESDQEFALRLINHAIAMNPNDVNSVMLATIQHLTGDPDVAQKTLRQAILANPAEEAQVLKRFERLKSIEF